jgi:hypothetical protein
VEGPAVLSTSSQLHRKPRLFIRSSLTCLRQVERGINELSEAVITTITPNASAPLPFVIPSGAEGSAVHSAFATKVHGKNELSSRPKRTRISCHAAVERTANAPLRKERRMKFAEATKFHRKSGGAKWRDLLSKRFGRSVRALSKP